MNEQSYVQRMLSRFNFMVGSVLIEANLRDFGNVFELVLEGYYPGSGDAKHEVCGTILLLRLINIQDIVYQTQVFDGAGFSGMHWEPGELDYIHIVNDPAYLKRFDNLAMLFNHVEIKWKNERRMQVVFSGLEVITEETADQFMVS